MVLSIFLLLIIGAYLAFSVLHFFTKSGVGKVAHQGKQGLEEVVLEDNESGNKLAVIEVQGVITGEPVDHSGRTMVTMIKDQLDRAEEDDAVKGVLLKVDSPGGEVLASDDIYRALVDFQDKSGKPVIASMGGLAASGGYYISAPCRWIVANELTITGSIGVIMSSYNYRGLMEKVGVIPEVYKSGKHKDMLSGSKLPAETSPEERAMVQALIDETFGKFKQIVAEGRGAANQANKGKGRLLISNWQDYADGRILSGKQALEHGFVDELGNFDSAVDRAMEIAGVKDANLVSYQPPFGFSDLLHMFGKTEAPAIRIDMGVSLPKLQAGRMYYLSSSYLQ